MTTTAEDVKEDLVQATVEAPADPFAGHKNGPWWIDQFGSLVTASFTLVHCRSGWHNASDADKALMAAAPLLLEALKKADAALARMEDQRPGMQIHLHSDVKAIKEARALARKALGANQP